MIPRLTLIEEDQDQAYKILQGYLDDPSKIVQTNALQALFDLAQNDQGLIPSVISTLEDHALIGSPAVKNRAQKLLKEMVRIHGFKKSRGGCKEERKNK